MTETKTVTIPADLHARLANAADERVLGIGLLTERLIEASLARLVPVSELQLIRDDDR